MKRLLAITRTDPQKSWNYYELTKWDKIDFVQFPNIDSYDHIEKITEIAISICKSIGEFYKKCEEEEAEGYVMLDGDRRLCNKIWECLHDEKINWVFPISSKKRG